MSQIIAVVIALAIGICGTLLFVYIKDMNERLAKLEKASLLRVPFKTQDQLLDVMALLDTVLDEKELESEISRSKHLHQEKRLQEAKDRLALALAVGTKREE